MVGEVQRAHHKLENVKNEKSMKEKESKRSERRPKARQTLGKFGKWLFSLLLLVQNWLCVSAAAEGPKKRTEAMVRMQQEVQVKEGRWAGEIPQRWRQLKGEEWTEKKEARVEMRTAQWIGLEHRESKYMRRYKGKCDICFGIHHRMRKEEVEEQFNKEARITDERAGIEDRKHTSGGVFVSTATWGQWLEQKKGSMGERQRRFARLLGVFLAHRRLDSDK